MRQKSLVIAAFLLGLAIPFMLAPGVHTYYLSSPYTTDCPNTSCSNAGQLCVSGGNMFMCDTTTSLYKSISVSAPPGSGGSGSPTVLSLQPQSSVPFNCSGGQMIMLTNGAICHCYATDSWENVGGTGVCEVSTGGSGNPGHQL